MKHVKICAVLLLVAIALVAEGTVQAYEFSAADAAGNLFLNPGTTPSQQSQGYPSTFIPWGRINDQGDLGVNQWDGGLAYNAYVLRNAHLTQLFPGQTNFVRDITNRDATGRVRLILSDAFGNNRSIFWEDGSIAATLPPGVIPKLLSGDGHIAAEKTISSSLREVHLLWPNGTMRANIHALALALDPKVQGTYVTAMASSTTGSGRVVVVGEVQIASDSGAISAPFFYSTDEGLQILHKRRLADIELETVSLDENDQAYAAGLASPVGQTERYPVVCALDTGFIRVLSRLDPLGGNIYQQASGVSHRGNTITVVGNRWNYQDSNPEQQLSVRWKLTFNPSTNTWTESPPAYLSALVQPIPNATRFDYVYNINKNGCFPVRVKLGSGGVTTSYIRPVLMCPVL